MNSQRPKNWPTSVRYIKRPVLSKSLSVDQIAQIRQNELIEQDSKTVSALELPILSTRPSPVKICKISDPKHPACNQYGLFATQQLEPSAFIIMYLGFVHGESEVDPTSDYDLSLDRDTGVSVDSTSMGNEARFINDYRGIREEGPNAEFKDCWLRLDGAEADREGKYHRCIGVFVLSEGKSGKRKKGIAKDEEILVSYGKGFWNERTASLIEQ